MGYSKKGGVDSGVESEGRKWVIAGIAMRSSLKAVNTKARSKDTENGHEQEEEEGEYSTTPTAREARIPQRLPCPPAPRKRRPPKPSASWCHYNHRDFFIPPDLDSVFKCYAEKAN